MNIHYVATYLVYIAALIRTASWHYAGEPVQPPVIGMMAVYGLVLFSEPALTRRLRWYRWVYMAVQSGLTTALLFPTPRLDFLATLYIPLSFHAVLFFQRRAGFLWIGAFTLAMAHPLITLWESPLVGLTMVLLFTAADLMAGNYAHLIRRSETTRRENQRLLGELQAACRQLQDYAAQLEEFAAIQERHHMARELHDSVTQTLFSMNLAVQAAHMMGSNDPARVAMQLDRLQELASSAMGEIQMLVNQLRPRSLSEEGMVSALRRLVAERQARDGLEICLEVFGERDLPEPVLVGLYRIAQEALNNVAKHARTDGAVVRLNLSSHPLYLEVEDCGRGFEMDTLSHRLDQIGLPGMAERARELGWRLDVDSQPGRGTRIRAEEKLVWQASASLQA